MSGQNGLLRGGFERAEGVPDRNSTYKPFSSETLAMARPYEPDPNLDPSGNETAGDNLKAEGKGKVEGAPNTESWLHERIHQHGFYEKTNPGSGVYLYELRDFVDGDDTPLDHYVDSLWYGVWRDQESLPSEYNILGAKVETFEMSVAANKFVKFSHDLLFLRDRYMGNPLEVDVDAAYTGDWVARGHRRSGDENGPFVAIKITDAGAVGTAHLVYGSGTDLVSLTSVGTLATATTAVPHGLTTGNTVTVSGSDVTEYNVTAAVTVTGTTTFTYAIADADDEPSTGDVIAIRWGATEYTIVDDWMTVVTPADALFGTRREPVQIRPTPQDGDLFTVGDIWRIDPRSPKPTPVYSDRPKLSGVDLELDFTVGGVSHTRVIDQYSLKMGTPREAKFALGWKYAGRIGQPAQSKKWWEVSFSETYLDRIFEQALISGTTVAAHAKLYGSLIGSTGLEDFAEFTLTNTKLSKAGATVTSPGELKETVTLRAFSVDGSPLCVEKYQNTIASVSPA